MKTEDLINVLSTNVEPVDPRQTGKLLTKAILLGVALSVGIAVAWAGTRPDLGDVRALSFLFLKVFLAVTIVIIGAHYLVRLGRPGSHVGVPHINLGVPALVLGSLAILAMVALPLMHLHHMSVDDDWLECLISIPVIAVVPFAAVVWAMRKMAPTNLPLTGAVVGVVAGGISAIGYALHCTGDSLSFIALWYGAAIALCSLAGALLGPHLLRW